MHVFLLIFLCAGLQGEEWQSAALTSYENGLRWLVDNQNEDGSWGGSQWTGGVDQDPAPGAFQSFDVAVTAMCLEALFPWRDEEAYLDSTTKARSFLEREFPQLRRPHPHHLPNIWAYCYGIQVLARYLERGSEAEKQWAAAEIRNLMAGLQRFEIPGGGWFYYAGSSTRKPDAPSASFVNAAVLTALRRAQEQGVEVDRELVQRALRATRLQRKPDSTFLYSARTPLDRQGAMSPINRLAGSLGRSQAGNYALRVWGDPAVTHEVIDHWLNRLTDRQGWLDMGRKRPIPHESHAGVAGYFYYFGHYYASLCIEEASPGKQADYREALAAILLARQEKDGSWFDYPLYRYHKPYGTAFAVLSLHECLH
ncbi:MAG: prenyltransferase/squalene oxidase repeat-containing protein [Verrucomicrobiota bacterium JB023]|nr:prenyltransferase/squalene oxidase repeat-containing protein [Verrucomicrobiota bacterium JB023]